MLPIIDVTGLDKADTGQIARIGFDIGQACRDTGFFYITGHGVSSQSMEAVFAASQAFFARPLEEKKALSIHAKSGNRGYVHLRTEALDPGHNVDNKEAFNIGLELEPDDPEMAAGVMGRAPNFWPEIRGFRQTMLDYFGAMHRLGCDLHRAIAMDLGVAQDFFAPLLSKPMATLRLLHYPDAVERRGDYGAGTHTDYGNITILLTDEVGGLQVQTVDGEWIDAPYVPGAFVCNIGDCLMRWTNDVYKSTPHRVIEPIGSDRYSIAFFLDANPEAIVDVLDSCTGLDHPKKYAPITAADYLKSRFAETYGFGKKEVSSA